MPGILVLFVLFLQDARVVMMPEATRILAAPLPPVLAGP